MRVIAGTLRGRRLVHPSGLSTRPTADRVREALFSILGNISGARVLDLYAGTGALGIEALSRGAQGSVFVESDRAALRAIRENMDSLNLASQSQVLPLRVERAEKALTALQKFDLIFADPPYAQLADAARVLEQLSLSVFENNARLVIEHSTRDTPPQFPGLAEFDRRTYGDTSLTMYVKI